MALIAAAISFALLIPTARSGTRLPVPPFWWALGVCETGHIGEPGDGSPRFDWGSKHRHLEGSQYEGFVGFASSTWTMWAQAIGVPYRHAWQAPPMVQVRVARFGLAHGGYWGCLREHPELFALPGR